MSSDFDFDSEADHGIFDNPEKRAAGDPAALNDFEDDESVPKIVLGLTHDGFVQSSVEEFDFTHEPLTVDWRSLICLAGPCRWYTELIRPVDPLEPQEIEVCRWCGRLRTWAEQTSLNEARVYGCTAFEPSGEFTPDVAEALEQNIAELRYIRQEADDQKVNLGICVAGPCEHFVEVVRHAMVTNEDITRESLRFCSHLAGLGRLYDVREYPSYGCTAFKPKGVSPLVSAANTKNRIALQAFRDRMAGKSKDETHGTERRDNDWSALGSNDTDSGGDDSDGGSDPGGASSASSSSGDDEPDGGSTDGGHSGTSAE